MVEEFHFSINSIAIVYDKEKLGREIKDWSDLWSEDLKGKVATLIFHNRWSIILICSGARKRRLHKPDKVTVWLSVKHPGI